MDPINLFFSCDDTYVPFLTVTLRSLQDHCDKSRTYIARILHTGLNTEMRAQLAHDFSAPWFTVEFVDIRPRVKEIFSKLHTRDYFSQSTYYRLFIPELFPTLKKCLYLDSDLTVLHNIAELYDTDMGDSLVGAVTDSFVIGVPELREYVCKRLGIADAEQYFNAGVLLMNLEQMRKMQFERIFLELLEAVTFRVAQDQDYLNVLCRDRVCYLDAAWNTMPRGATIDAPKLIHYNVDSKPWHQSGIPYERAFWHYADACTYREAIHALRDSYSQEDTARSVQETIALIALAKKQADDADECKRIQAEIARVLA